MSHVTQVNPGLGTTLKVTISAILTAVAQVLTIDGPEQSVGTVETTNLSSTVKTFRPTIPEAGKISGTLQFDPQDATHLELQTLISSPPQGGNAMSLTMADASPTVYTFTGILTKLKPTGMEIESNLEAEFEIQITGAVTHAP